MGKPLEIAALKLIGDIARGMSRIQPDKQKSKSFNPQSPECIHEIDRISKRILFTLIVALYMEENKYLPDTVQFRDKTGIYQIRHRLTQGRKEYGGKRFGISNTIRKTITAIHEGGENLPPFQARLFEPSNLQNHLPIKWKFHDSSIIDSLEELFRLWPHPESSLLAMTPPDLRNIVDIYPYLLDFELVGADEETIILKGGEKAIPVKEAHPSESKRGYLIHTGELYYRYAKNKSRVDGTVYTPDEIVKRIVSRTLEPLLQKNKSDAPLRILDPSCGTGRFLLGALDFLTESSKSDIKSIITNSLFGIDTDPLAVELAEVQLMLRMHKLENPAPQLKDNLIVADSLIGIDSRFIERYLREEGNADGNGQIEQTTIDKIDWKSVWERIAGKENPQITQIAQIERQKLLTVFDSMVEHVRSETVDDFEKEFKFKVQNLDNVKQPKHCQTENCIKLFHPEIFFPHLYFNSDGEPLPHQGFDAVIGNPPYGDILSSESKELLRKLGYSSGGGGNNDIFRFFVERGLILLRTGGMLGFILPNTFLKGKKYRNFRKRLLELSQPVEILDFDLAKIFERDVFTSLLFLLKKPSRKTVPIFITSLDGTLNNLKTEKFDSDSLSDDSWIPSGELYKRLLSDKRFVPLDPLIAQIGDVGINYQRKDVGWSNRSASRIASEIFYEGEREHPDDLPYLKGVDIERFVINPKSKRWLRHDWKNMIQDGETVSVNLAWAQKPIKILTRQTGDSIVAAIDKSGYLTGRSLHTTILRDTRYSPYYILALLNSDLMNRIYLELTRERGRAQAQVKLSFLRRLPIRRISFDMDEKLRIEIVKKETQRLEEDFSIPPRSIKELTEKGYEAVAHDLIAYYTMKIDNFFSYGSNVEEKKFELKSILNNAIEILYKAE